MLGKERFNVIGLQTRGGIEEMKDFGRWLNAIFGGHFRVNEPIVF